MRDTADSELKRIAAVWDEYAKTDPLWAILSRADKKGGRWAAEEFFQTGVDEIARIFALLEKHDIRIDRTSALDFGCGVGRLTQPLCSFFEIVHGVDISPHMVRTAEQLNQYPDRCTYHVNTDSNLRRFNDGLFSFAYSNIVLQHIEPHLMRKYLMELCRVVGAGGLLIFQLPSKRVQETGLHDAACLAIVDCLKWPAQAAPSVDVQLIVKVTNASQLPWQFDQWVPLALGNHWLTQQGEMLRQDDGRAVLPNPLRPGETAEVSLTIRTPPRSGDYILELDVVQEGVTWFAQKGSPALRLPIHVQTTSENDALERPTAESETVQHHATDVFDAFAMHCMPRPEVTALLNERNCRLEYIQESHNAGPGYQSYLYFARKASRT